MLRVAERAAVIPAIRYLFQGISSYNTGTIQHKNL